MYESNQAGALSVVGKPVLIRSVTIQDNVLDDINGVSICLIGVSDATITGNRFTRLQTVEPQNTGGQIGVDQHCVIFAAGCTDLRLLNNSVDRRGPFTGRLVDGDYFKSHTEAAKGLRIGEH